MHRLENQCWESAGGNDVTGQATVTDCYISTAEDGAGEGRVVGRG